MVNNINEIKDKTIKELMIEQEKKKIKIQKYEQYINKIMELFINILKYLDSIHSLLKLNKNDKLSDLINKYPFNIKNLNLDDLTKVLNEEYEQFKNYIKNRDNDNNKQIENNIMDNFNNNIVSEEKDDFNIIEIKKKAAMRKLIKISIMRKK